MLLRDSVYMLRADLTEELYNPKMRSISAFLRKHGLTYRQACEPASRANQSKHTNTDRSTYLG
jgi:hypothetical protein